MQRKKGFCVRGIDNHDLSETLKVYLPILAKRFKTKKFIFLKEHSLQLTQQHVSVGPLLKEYLPNSYLFEIFFYLCQHQQKPWYKDHVKHTFVIRKPQKSPVPILKLSEHLNKINKVHIQQVFYLPSLYWISSNSLKLLIEVLTEVKIFHQNVNSKL